MVIFQTALWVGWLTDNSSTNDLISIYSDDFSHDQAMTFVILTIFGCLAGYVLTTDVSNSDILGESVLSPSSADLLVALLVVSAILYLLRMSSSLYYVFLAFIGSVLVRIMETSEINLTTLTLISIILIGYLSILSLPFINSILDGSFYRLKKSNSILNPEEYISESTFQTSDFGEISYDTSLLDDIEFTMNSDNSPISKPKRPSRRSEYEMYEWVLLLANFILWPSVLVISIVLGSEVEISGSSFSMDDNYMMLLGPLGLTAFFFTLLYRMDANARDGSLYKGEKQAYLDEMEKFIEAKRAYLDLVTLQAEVKQAQLREENPTLQKNSHTSTSE
jgi:hypothetical protein